MKPAVVLLPGLLCDAWVWSSQQEALSPDYAVSIPSLFGPDSLNTMAQRVLDTAPPAFALAGHSMGARVALEVVRLAPGRVTRLALLDTGIHATRDGEAASRGALVRLAYDAGMAAMAAQWLPPMVAPARRDDAPLIAALTRMVERATPEIFEAQQQALLTRPDTGPALAAVACPTTVIVGRQDVWSPVAQHEAIVAAIPGARLVIVEDCGHMSTVEQPQAVSGALRAWLDAPAPDPK